MNRKNYSFFAGSVHGQIDKTIASSRQLTESLRRESKAELTFVTLILDLVTSQSKERRRISQKTNPRPWRSKGWNNQLLQLALQCGAQEENNLTFETFYPSSREAVQIEQVAGEARHLKVTT